MTISFNPGQPQAPTQTGTQGPVTPAEPAVPTIATNGPVAPVVAQSPFAFKHRSKSKFGMYFQFVIFGIFALVVLQAVGLFAYQRILMLQLDEKRDQLTQKEANFKKLPLDDMQKLSDRIAAVNQAMSEHITVRDIFKVLEYGVENPVTYTKFDLSYSENKKGYTLSIQGVAPNYYAVIQQYDTLRNNINTRYLSSVALNKVALDDKLGVVNFSFDGIVTVPVVPPDLFDLEMYLTKATTTAKTATTTSAVPVSAPTASTTSQ
jgi:hypothetical protein